jgi:hypothetical protein
MDGWMEKRTADLSVCTKKLDKHYLATKTQQDGTSGWGSHWQQAVCVVGMTLPQRRGDDLNDDVMMDAKFLVS